MILRKIQFKFKIPKLFHPLQIFCVILIIFSTILMVKVKDNLIKGENLRKSLSLKTAEVTELKNQDQYKINQELKSEIENINRVYKKATKTYEALLDLSELTDKTATLEAEFAKTVSLLSERNYASAQAKLIALDKSIIEISAKENSLLSSASNFPKTANAPSSNTPPGAGYSRQNVQALGGSYLVDIVASDLSTTRVIVDTAANGDCRDNCPVLALSDYVGRNGAFAGINGSYFCPSAYPSCAGKTNTFDTLLMNKNKVYFNSENNVYSNVPAVIFLSGAVRFVGASSEWGRDTGVDGVLANQGLLLSGGSVVFGGDGDPKKGSKGARSFVGSKGSTVYIGVVHNASVAESAYVLKALGLEGALNLDSGGSTAFWSGGYRVGPGRNIPNAILFVRK